MRCLFHCNTGTLTKQNFIMFCNVISLKHIVGTYVGGTTLVCNAKNILGVFHGISFHRIPSWLGLWKVDNMWPSFKRDKFCSTFPKYWPANANWRQVHFAFVLYSGNNFYFEENIFFGFNNIFLLKTYVITHPAKTYLPSSILKCFNQVYESNKRKTFIWTNTKLCRTQTSFDSFNCIYNEKAHMLNIFYSLKTINFLKIKRLF